MKGLDHLISRAQEGDLEAYDMLVRRFQSAALGYARAVLGDFHLAEDAVQEAFVEAYAQLPGLRSSSAFSKWLRRIVFKHCDRLTRKKRLPTIPLESIRHVAADIAGPAAELERQWVCEKVMEALQNLSDFERRLMRLFYLDGYSQKEIAAYLELPTTTINNRLHATRRQLRERMDFAMRGSTSLTDFEFATELARTALSHYAIDETRLDFAWGKMRVSVGDKENPGAYLPGPLAPDH